MGFLADPNMHMWFALIVTLLAIISFVRERVSLEVTSVGLLTALLLFGQMFPLSGENGQNLLSATPLLVGFANPSLIAVLALLVMGQAMIQTDALRIVTNGFSKAEGRSVWFAILGIFVFVMVVSAFMNNTPLVVIAIPLLQVLARSANLSISRFMIPLSYIAILGGMTTLIGSSTNLLVSSTMLDLGYAPLQFFDFVVPGAFLAGVGFIYVLFVAPRLLSARSNMAQDLVGVNREFVAELEIAADSKLVGAECEEGSFQVLGDIGVRLIQRGGQLILPPFEGYTIEKGDVLIVAAPRDVLTDMLAKYPGFLLSEDKESRVASAESSSAVVAAEASENEQQLAASGDKEDRILAEIMITPASRMVDMSMEHVNFERQFKTLILGIQRRAKVVRRRLGRIRLESGDVLLISGSRGVIDALRNNPDFIILSGSKQDLPLPRKAPIAAIIFLVVITIAAMGIFSIPAAAITGAVLMIATGCLNIRQATRAVDRKIFLLVGSMLALGYVLQVTGAAEFIASSFMSLPFVDTPFSILASLFIFVAVMTNLLSNNACAILFTPIAMSIADSLSAPEGLQYDLAFIFALTVIFGANCSFASPIGYQTNLLVMGPGHYSFRDFIKAGVPLVLILWVAYMVLLKFYFGL